MKRVSAWLLAGMLLLLVGASGMAQQYNLQFRVDQDANTASGDFDVTLRIAANDTANVFELGSCNLVFDYNTASLTAPGLIGPGPDSLQIQAIHNFSGGNYQKLRLTQPAAGRLSLNIELNSPGTGTTVLPTFMDIATIRFSIVDAGQPENLAWRTASPNATLVFDQNETALALADSLYGPALLANLKVFLEGPYDSTSNTMATGINDQGFLPLIHPFSQSPWSYGKVDTATSIPADIVDWVLIELRTGTSATDSIDSRAALLKSNGSIVDLNGSSPVTFNVPAGNYYVVIYHRNHLGVMSASAVTMAETAPATLYNFTTDITQYFGTNGAHEIESGVWGMISGDANGDGGIFGEDFIQYRLNQGVEGYSLADFNMDGGVFGEDFILYRLNQGEEAGVTSPSTIIPQPTNTSPKKSVLIIKSELIESEIHSNKTPRKSDITNTVRAAKKSKVLK